MLRNILVTMIVLAAPMTWAAARTDEKQGEIASEVSTGTSGADGTRVSKDSDWTKFTVPDGYVIVKDKTDVKIVSERGSEHTYDLQYADDVEVVSGTGIKQPTTIQVKTHARSSKGPFGGGGGMKVEVKFTYVKFK